MWKEVLKARYLGGYKIKVMFNDGVWMTVDLSDLPNLYPVFAPLSDISLFQNFTLTDTLEWCDGTIDIAPEYLYDHGVICEPEDSCDEVA